MSSPTGLDPPLPDPNEWNASSVVPCVVVALGLATVCVGLRFWARAGILHVVGLEDWLILAALVSGTGQTTPFPVSVPLCALSANRVCQGNVSGSCGLLRPR